MAETPVRLPQGQDRPTSHSIFEEALRYRALGLPREAEGACLRVLQRDHQHAGALHMLGIMAHESGSNLKAEDLLLSAMRAAPRDPVAHNNFGLVQIALKRPAQAITAFQRALSLNPSLAAVHNNLGIALKDLGRFDEAQASYQKALELDPRYAAAHQNMGEVRQRQGRLRDAKRCFEAALQLDGRLIGARISLGNVLADLGEFHAAADCYRQTIAENPRSANLYGNLGLALKGMGDIAGSLDAFRRAVAAEPDSAEAHFNLAHGLLRSGDVRQASACARRAMQLRNDFQEARTLYAATLAAQGNLEEGVRELRNVLAPETPLSHGYRVLGAKLASLGLSNPALGCLEKAVESDPNDGVARHLVAALNGSNPDHPADGYVRQLFDAYAASFDHHLVEELNYTIPGQLAAEVLATHQRESPWDVLDLGCGTGLVGVEIATHARSLVGVDVSARMIERALVRNIYTDLKLTDLMTALQGEPPASYDLVTAADVFIYVGKLDSVVSAVRAVLRKEGLFAFTVEAWDLPIAAATTARTANQYFLGNKGRYVHSVGYLTELAARNDFTTKVLRKTRIRSGSGQPVMGWLAVWEV